MRSFTLKSSRPAGQLNKGCEFNGLSYNDPGLLQRFFNKMTFAETVLYNNPISSKRLSVNILILSFFVSILLLFLPLQRIDAQVTVNKAWSQLYANTAYPTGAVSASYTIPNGSRRLLVVAVAATRTSTGTLTCSATYGGVAMTAATGDGTASGTWNHTFVFYLKDADIGSASAGKSLNVTVSGGTSYYSYVAAAVYAGVDQTTTGDRVDRGGPRRSSPAERGGVRRPSHPVRLHRVQRRTAVAGHRQ